MKKVNETKYDIMVLMDVKNGNMNGDPARDNYPRMDDETGQGQVSSVSTKRKLRDQMAFIKGDLKPQEQGGYTFDFEEGYELLVCKNTFLSKTLEDAFDKNTTAEQKKDKNINKAATSIPERMRRREYVCKDFVDARLFGAVLNVGKYKSESIHGAVQVHMANSVDPISPQYMQVTRVCKVDGKEAKDGSGVKEDGAENGTFGGQYYIPYGLYTQVIKVNPRQCVMNGVTEEDIDVFLEAIPEMFENTVSATSGEQVVRHVIVCEKVSNESSTIKHVDMRSIVKVEKKEGVEVARSIGDYDITIDKSQIPTNVKIYDLMGVLEI